MVGSEAYPIHKPAALRSTRMTPTASVRSCRSIVVINGGVSARTAAYLPGRTHDVTLFEGDDRLGGQARTRDVTPSDGTRHAVDGGLIVHNDRIYGWLRKGLAELDVAVPPAAMSMSIHCERSGLRCSAHRQSAVGLAVSMTSLAATPLDSRWPPSGRRSR